MINKLKQYGFFSFGTIIPGLTIQGAPAPYPVLNERSIRAGAGIVFAAGFFAFFQAFYLENFLFIKILVIFLLFDFFAKTVLGLRFSPISRLAELIVSNQKPEYVGAIQKRFAWSIGLVLATLMTVFIYILNLQGPPTLIVCGICLTFMFMESAFGICVGCKIYNTLLKLNILPTPDHKPACPGGVCSIE